MKCFWLLLLIFCGCRTQWENRRVDRTGLAPRLERIVVTADGRGFETAQSKQPFRPWGMNYGNSGRLMEDFWNEDWKTLADDFHKLQGLGANVVRVHLQFGKFMDAPDKPNTCALRQLKRLVGLAEETGLYLDITGLACYRPADVPKWYDSMTESARWEAQAAFWESVAEACASSPAIFCYDLMNEPLSPGEKREPGAWSSGKLFGGYDFLQFIALDPAGRRREEIPVQWIRRMTLAIRRHDRDSLITVGLLPWSPGWKHLSGFIPEKIAPELSFISVHLYPEDQKPGEALESLRKFAVGKPVVIEEIFQLHCSIPELEAFMRESREDRSQRERDHQLACGWIGHYDGKSLTELDALARDGKITITQSMYRDWLELFVRLKPAMVGTANHQPAPN